MEHGVVVCAIEILAPVKGVRPRRRSGALASPTDPSRRRGLADINVAARQGVISSSTGARAVRKAPQRHWVAVRRVEEVMVEPRMASSLTTRRNSPAPDCEAEMKR